MAHAGIQKNETLEAARHLLWSVPRAFDLVEMIEAPAALCPDAPAFHLSHHAVKPEAVTWGELWSGARAEATELRKAGLKQGDRVILILPTSRAFFKAFFGILIAGGVPVPVAPPQSLKVSKLDAYFDLLRNIAADSGAMACISLPRLLLVLKATLHEINPQMQILSAEQPETVTDSIEPFRPEPNATALLQYTSGSTSRPKGVELTHRNIIANVSAIAAKIVYFDSICVSWLPLYHDMGLIGTALCAFYSRAHVIFMPPQVFVKDPATWLQSISDYRATITVAPNFAFNYCAKNVEIEQLAGVRLDSLRTMLNGAEPVDPAAVEGFYEKFKPLGLRDGVVLPVYGLAESTLAVTFSDPGPYRIDLVDAERLEKYGQAIQAEPQSRSRAFISVGRPIPTQEVRIFDFDDRALDDRVVGEIVVRGPSVMKGYFSSPSETARALRGGWLRTGDLGYLADGRLYVTGRIKDLIIRYGKNYYPQDIEHLIARIEGIRKGGVVAFSIESNSEAPVVIVAETRLRDNEALSKLDRQIRQQCHDAFMFGPDDVRLVSPGTIPRTTSGKVRRQACKQLYMDGDL